MWMTNVKHKYKLTTDISFLTKSLLYKYNIIFIYKAFDDKFYTVFQKSEDFHFQQLCLNLNKRGRPAEFNLN